jgi:hypothetical protein
VQRRAIALVLADLLRTLDDRLGFLRPRAVVGVRHQSDPTYYVRLFVGRYSLHILMLVSARSISTIRNRDG